MRYPVAMFIAFTSLVSPKRPAAPDPVEAMIIDSRRHAPIVTPTRPRAPVKRHCWLRFKRHTWQTHDRVSASHCNLCQFLADEGLPAVPHNTNVSRWRYCVDCGRTQRQP